MRNTVTAFCLSLYGLGVLGAPTSNCPQGKKYYDKHLGQHGRWQCCSELCEALVYKDLCLLKCPDYKRKEEPSPEAADTPDRADHATIIIIIALLAAFSVIILGVFLFRRRQQQNGRNGRVRTTGESVLMSDLQGRPPHTTNPALTERLLNTSHEDLVGRHGQEEADGSSGRSDRTEPKDHVSSPSSGNDSSGLGSDYQTAKVEGGAPIQVEGGD